MSTRHPAEPQLVVGALPDVVETLVVPLDGSEHSRAALPVAHRLARRLSASICLVSAVPTVDDVAPRERELERIPLPRARRPIVVVDLDPAGAIHETLRRLPHSVACMATHGRGRSARLLGSVAAAVLARAHDPLILAGPLVGDYAPWLGHVEPHGVVASVDENGAIDVVVGASVRWAKLLHERLVILTVAEPVPPTLGLGEFHRRTGPDGDVESFLAVLATRARHELSDVDTRAVYDPAGVGDGLRTYLREHPAELVVISSRVRAGASHAVFGGDAADILRGCPAPVLAVPVVTRPPSPWWRRLFRRDRAEDRVGDRAG